MIHLFFFIILHRCTYFEKKIVLLCSHVSGYMYKKIIGLIYHIRYKIFSRSLFNTGPPSGTLLRNRNDFTMLCKKQSHNVRRILVLTRVYFCRTEENTREKKKLIIIICFALCMDYFSDLFSLPLPVTSSDADGFVVSLFLFLCET